MKSVIKKTNRTYPYLGVYNQHVVLFTNPKSGFFVYLPDDNPENNTLGNYSEEFDEEAFVKFDGMITLSN